MGSLQAAEERLIAVQDFESRLDELDKLAETYRVRARCTCVNAGLPCQEVQVCMLHHAFCAVAGRQG